MWAVIPVKDLANAKQRLAEALDPSERRRLFRCMFEDVLATVSRARRLAGVMVVTRDATAAEIARERGARVLREDQNRGQSAAVGHAAAVLADEGVAGMLTLPGDVPLVTEEEIAAVLDAHGGAHGAAPALSIVPARDGRGSNCMALTPPAVIPFHFGDDSFLPHLEEARRRGIAARVLELPGLGLDIDSPADLRELLRRPGAGAVHAYLETSGIAARLETPQTSVAPSLAAEVSA